MDQVGAPTVEPRQGIGPPAHDCAFPESGSAASSKRARLAHQVHRPETTITTLSRFVDCRLASCRPGLPSRRLRWNTRGLAAANRASLSCGAGGMDRREDHLVKERKENLRHLGNRLVAQATEDERPRPLTPRHPELLQAARSAQAPAGLCATSRIHSTPSLSMRSSRPGQRVLRMPSAMAAGVIGKAVVASQLTAAAMARATLRC
jgi:hypothetical protein